MYGKIYRAHPDGVYLYSNGGLRRTEEVDEQVLRQIELAMVIARNMFLKLARDNIPQMWEPVFQCISSFQGTAPSRKSVCSKDFKPPLEADGNAVWALDMAKLITQLSSQYVGKGKSTELVDSFGLWYQSERPDSVGVLNFLDATLIVRTDGAEDEDPLRQ
eukprot:9873000-Heterocapsa_arctica.AAC.1